MIQGQFLNGVNLVLNAEFYFSETVGLIKYEEHSVLYYLHVIQEEELEPCLFQGGVLVV